MSFTPVSGIGASVKIGTTTYAFEKWKISFKSGLPKVNNFTSVYQQLVGGITSATVTLEGPYDEGNMAFSVGSAVSFILSWDGSTHLTVPVLLESIDPSQDVNDAGRVSVVGQSTGSFTAAIT